jgi:hypothetical protein
MIAKAVTPLKHVDGLQIFEQTDPTTNCNIRIEFYRRPNVSHKGQPFLTVDKLECSENISHEVFKTMFEDWVSIHASDCYQVMFFSLSQRVSRMLKEIEGVTSRTAITLKPQCAHTSQSQDSI